MAHRQVLEEEMKMKRTTTVRTPLEGIHVVVLDQLVIRMVNSQASLLEEEMETGCKLDFVSSLSIHP